MWLRNPERVDPVEAGPVHRSTSYPSGRAGRSTIVRPGRTLARALALGRAKPACTCAPAQGVPSGARDLGGRPRVGEASADRTPRPGRSPPTGVRSTHHTGVPKGRTRTASTRWRASEQPGCLHTGVPDRSRGAAGARAQGPCCAHPNALRCSGCGVAAHSGVSTRWRSNQRTSLPKALRRVRPTKQSGVQAPSCLQTRRGAPYSRVREHTARTGCCAHPNALRCSGCGVAVPRSGSFRPGPQGAR